MAGKCPCQKTRINAGNFVEVNGSLTVKVQGLACWNIQPVPTENCLAKITGIYGKIRAACPAGTDKYAALTGTVDMTVDCDVRRISPCRVK